MDNQNQPQPARQLLRPTILASTYDKDDQMVAAFDVLVQGRPGWFKNIEENQWYYDPNSQGQISSDQTTQFSEADLIFPKSQEAIDAYFMPVDAEVKQLLLGNPDWHFDEKEKGWVYGLQPASASFFQKLRKLFGSNAY